MILEAIQEELAETLKARVLTVFGRAVDRVVFERRGDLSTPVAIELAGALGRPPREVAGQLARGMRLPLLVERTSADDAGHLYFHFDRGAFTAEHFRAVTGGAGADELTLQQELSDEMWELVLVSARLPELLGALPRRHREIVTELLRRGIPAAGPV